MLIMCRRYTYTNGLIFGLADLPRLLETFDLLKVACIHDTIRLYAYILFGKKNKAQVAANEISSFHFRDEYMTFKKGVRPLGVWYDFVSNAN
jgi:hypothetical protein